MIIAGADFHQQQAGGGYRQQGGSIPTNGQQLTNAYKVLGVDKGVAMPAIKKAYKKLMSQHHPDKLIAKGLPPEMMESAKQKTQEIQGAYDVIVKQRK